MILVSFIFPKAYLIEISRNEIELMKMSFSGSISRLSSRLFNLLLSNRMKMRMLVSMSIFMLIRLVGKKLLVGDFEIFADGIAGFAFEYADFASCFLVVFVGDDDGDFFVLFAVFDDYFISLFNHGQDIRKFCF